jgi:hypothetical protein
MKRRVMRNSHSARTKRRGKPAATSRRRPKTPVAAKAGDALDDLVAASAQALGLSIEAAWRESVKFNLQLLLDHAARVDALPLPDEAEPAPVFHA